MEVFSGIVLIEAYQNGYRMSNQENIFPGKSTWLTFKFKKYDYNHTVNLFIQGKKNAYVMLYYKVLKLMRHMITKVVWKMI